MEKSLEALFEEIRSYEQNIVQPCRITKNNDTSFELWTSQGTSSVFFSSMSLHPDHLCIKFSPRLSNENQKDLKPYNHVYNEYHIKAAEINDMLKNRLQTAIFNLYLLYNQQQ